MSALPLAVRVAAGLAATAVEQARRLPQNLAELPVTAVSRAMQVSMRVQQQVTELAIKGDNAIALLRTPAEDPPWAVFDEDTEGGLYRLPDRTGDIAADLDDRADGLTAAGLDGDRADGPTAATSASAQDAARDWYEAEYAAAAVDTGESAAGRDDEAADLDLLGPDGDDLAADLERLRVEGDDVAADVGGPPGGTVAMAADTSNLAGTVAAETDDTATETDDTPRALPGYAELSLASVRARLRTYGVDELQELLDYEVAHEHRPEFVRMLTNRISMVRNQ